MKTLRRLLSILLIAPALAMTACDTDEPTDPTTNPSDNTTQNSEPEPEPEPEPDPEPEPEPEPDPDPDLPVDTTEAPISAVVDTNTYTVRGVVAAKNRSAIVIADDEAAIYIFRRTSTGVTNEYEISDFTIGDYLEVNAPGVSYNNTYQFYMDQSTISWITDVQPAFTLPEPTALTAEIAESWTSGEIPVTELKEYTWTATAGLDGTYNTLNIEDSDVSIQPVYLDSTVWTIETGTTYDVTAYFVGYYGYASIVLTALEAAE